MGERSGHTKAGGANVLVSRSSRGSECPQNRFIPSSSVREEVCSLRRPEGREDSRSTNFGCRFRNFDSIGNVEEAIASVPRLVIDGEWLTLLAMGKDVIPVKIRGILPANSGWAIFLGTEEKVFVIQVEHSIGAVIGMFLRDTEKERPLTHDLMVDVFSGFGISVERVIITELRNSTYFARMILQQQNELGRKVLEVDARPSDCIAMATAQKKPMYVGQALFDEVEDMSEVLQQINDANSESDDES